MSLERSSQRSHSISNYSTAERKDAFSFPSLYDVQIFAQTHAGTRTVEFQLAKVKDNDGHPHSVAYHCRSQLNNRPTVLPHPTRSIRHFILRLRIGLQSFVKTLTDTDAVQVLMSTTTNYLNARSRGEDGMPLSHQFLIFAHKQLNLRLISKVSAFKFAFFAGKHPSMNTRFLGFGQAMIPDKSWTPPGKQFLVFMFPAEDFDILSTFKHSEAVDSLPPSPSPQLGADEQIAYSQDTRSKAMKYPMSLQASHDLYLDSVCLTICLLCVARTSSPLEVEENEEGDESNDESFLMRHYHLNGRHGLLSYRKHFTNSILSILQA
ncbi:hypothetical protein BD410DRAFT_844255 [Rickenella mellea]|uniref:Uncharacterized protein n=1 Tax=Rickenella mellea TaxID=50990 RepID=A0A4Y7PNM5_9AGAM|nr:hypothetical protein BD410DRAFT_844255 [Rickenella mellea]